MYKLLLICLLALLPFQTRADSIAPKAKVKPGHKIQVLQKDSTTVVVRNFNGKALNQYRKNDEFNYYRDEDIRNLSWWDRYWKWLWRLIEQLFGGRKASSGTAVSPVIKYVLLGILVAMAVYVIIKMLGVANIFGRQSKQVDIPYSESLENIHEITFDEEIEKALAQRNYRLGVRLLYLRSLKHLNDARLIHWQIDKTNAAYINELTDNEQRQSFGILTRQFEYIWYGDFPIDVGSYQNIQTLFHDFKKLLP